MATKSKKNRPKSNEFKKPGKKRRKSKKGCLRCDKDFKSQGIYNRICPECRTSNEKVSPYALPENYPVHQPEK